MTDHQQLIATASGAATTSYEQRNAISELGKFEDAESLDALIRLLGHDDRYLRRDVVKAIGTHRSADSVLALIRCLNDETENIRRDAASLLGSKNDGRAIAALKMLLEDKGYAVRHAAESSLEMLEREAVTPVDFDPEALNKLFNTTSTPPHSPDANVLVDRVPADNARHTPTTKRSDKQPEHPDESSVRPPTKPDLKKSDGPKNTESRATGYKTEPPNRTKPKNAPTEDPDQTGRRTVRQANTEGDHATTTNSPNSDKHNATDARDKRFEPGIDYSAEDKNTGKTGQPPATTSTADHSESGGSQPFAHDTPPTSDLDEEIILAELVCDGTPPAAPKPDSSTDTSAQEFGDQTQTQLTSPTPPNNFDWTKAPRFNALFGAQIREVQRHYNTLKSLQHNALESEKRFAQAMLQHDLAYADLADDAKTQTEKASEQLESIKTQKKHAQTLAQAIKQAKRTSQSLTTLITAFFWPSRKQAVLQRIDDLTTKHTYTNHNSNRSSESLSATQQKSTTVLQPLKAAEQELLEASKSATSDQQQLRSIQLQIANAIIATLNTADHDQVERFLQHASCNITAKQCIEELKRHQIQYSSLKNSLFEINSPLNEDKRRFEQQATDLITAVADGFEKIPRTQEVKADVNVSVAFRSAPTSTNITNRLEGKAQGNAQLTTTYEYEETRWVGGNQLRDSLTQLNDSATQLASVQALHAIRSTELASTAHAAQGCVAYIRAELEQDFGVSK